MVRRSNFFPFITSVIWINPIVLFLSVKYTGGISSSHHVGWYLFICSCFIFWVFFNWKIDFKRNMRTYIKVYFRHFGYDESDFINCEICSSRAVDIHHINARGMGGSKQLDRIDNLMALCRICHVKYGDKKQYVDFLKQKHQEVLKKHSKMN